MNAIVLLSGGLDSLLTALKVREQQRCELLHVDYGQSAREVELAAVLRLGAWLDLPLHRASVSPFPRSRDPLGTNLIPARNTMLFALATALLPVHELGTIYIGTNASDYGYPDATPTFFAAWESMCRAQGRAVRVQAPVIGLTKVEIVKQLRSYDAPIEQTVSCWQPHGDRPCGECTACKMRGQALRQAGRV